MNTSRSCVEAMRPCHSVHVPNTAITPAGNSRYSMPLTYPYGVDVDQLLNVHTLDCQITSCETSLGGPLTATALSNRGNGSIASLLPQNEIGCKRAPNPVLGPSISRQTERVSSPVPGLHPYQVEYQTTGDQKDHPMHVDQTLRNWSAPGDCWRAGEAHEVARNTNIGGGRTSPRPVICEQRKEEAALGPYVDGAPEATNSDAGLFPSPYPVAPLGTSLCLQSELNKIKGDSDSGVGSRGDLDTEMSGNHQAYPQIPILWNPAQCMNPSGPGPSWQDPSTTATNIHVVLNGFGLPTPYHVSNSGQYLAQPDMAAPGSTQQSPPVQSQATSVATGANNMNAAVTTKGANIVSPHQQFSPTYDATNRPNMDMQYANPANGERYPIPVIQRGTDSISTGNGTGQWLMDKTRPVYQSQPQVNKISPQQASVPLSTAGALVPLPRPDDGQLAFHPATTTTAVGPPPNMSHPQLDVIVQQQQQQTSSQFTAGRYGGRRRSESGKSHLEMSTSFSGMGNSVYRMPDSGGFATRPMALQTSPASYDSVSPHTSPHNMALGRYTTLPYQPVAGTYTTDEPPGHEGLPGSLNIQGSPLRSRYLWLFLLRLLEDDRYSALIAWTRRRDMEFQLRQPEEVATLWGRVKRRSNMTYDKMSRAMRYYYRQNVLRKVRNKRYVYRFLRIPTMEQHQSPSLPAATPTAKTPAGTQPGQLAIMPPGPGDEDHASGSAGSPTAASSSSSPSLSNISHVATHGCLALSTTHCQDKPSMVKIISPGPRAESAGSATS